MNHFIASNLYALKTSFSFSKNNNTYPKIFCIGRNKTGTTSLMKAFQDLKFHVGDQRRAELLLPQYRKGNFEPILKYCKSAQVFQDFPFSYPGTFRYLDQRFEASKFILSIRDSAEEWYNSITKFHGKLYGRGDIPGQDDLKNARYVYKGWMWEANRALYSSAPEDPYNKQILLGHYNAYNNEIIEYFKGKDNLLILNLKESDAYHRFCQFVGAEPIYNHFPWENRTINIRIT
ncbi:hypothetical protein SAMN04515674_101268 [Pseudarcicella hirudinis]|uniref:Sulfotransferase family protein n=1 Tax=Pseudarcicella hirudinis TaxID=1079859 RepID=A0A1I5MF83_9BACT|nr:sulfotransferase [Pseudarcicella hirudinis]SFP07967.1 hypothetical protein SAMN04515674_101268 [Pseudarcicella hirudinis]